MPVNPIKCGHRRTYKSVITFAFSCLTFATASSSNPQTAPLETAPLEEIVVSASRNLLDQALSDSTTTYRLYPEQRVGPRQSIADMLIQAPGVSYNGQGGLFQSYSLRGFSRWRVRTEVNGVPLLIDRAAGSSASFIPSALLEQITISQGPGSTLYGSDAMGGVVSLSTVHRGSASYSLRWQDNDDQLMLSAKGSLNSALSASAALRRANNATDAKDGSLNTGFEQIALSLHGQTQWQDLALSASWLPVRGRDIGKSNANFPDTAAAHYPHDDHSIATVELRRDKRWLARLYHHRQDWASITETSEGGGNRTDFDADTIGALLYHQTPFSIGEGRAGIEWLGRRNVKINTVTLAPAETSDLFESGFSGSQDGIGLFIDHVWTHQDIALELGARYDHVAQEGLGASIDDGAWSTTLALSWQPDSPWHLSGKIGTGFRFPTLTERFSKAATPRGILLGNPSLKSEQNESLELRADYHSNGYQLSAATYYNWLDNYVERVILEPGIRTYINTEQASLWGYEVMLQWQLPAGLSHRLQYQYQRGTSNNDEWLSDLNPPSWRYGVQWLSPEFEFQTELVYRPSRDLAGPGEQPLNSAIWLDSQLGFNWLKHAKLTFFINNLFNEAYRGSADEQAPFQPGRTFGLGIEWTPS